MSNTVTATFTVNVTLDADEWEDARCELVDPGSNYPGEEVPPTFISDLILDEIRQAVLAQVLPHDGFSIFGVPVIACSASQPVVLADIEPTYYASLSDEEPF